MDVPMIQVETHNQEDDEVHEGGASNTSNGSDSDTEDKLVKLKLLPRSVRRDSGSSVGEEDDEIPPLTDEMKEKIVFQAEYYFSDENLKKDGFLLKHVKRNKEGYVNLKLLASFKKMRSLSRDYRVIGEALKDSKKLVVNETGLKLRRIEPLPKELLDQVRVKHIIVSKIPNENPSMNYITEAFAKHKDDVVSVRIVKPGKRFPNDLQSHFSRHPELRDEVVAVVEFDNADVATDAMKTEFTDIYKGLQIILLEVGPKQAKKMDGDAGSDTPIDSDSSTGKIKKSNKKNKNSSHLLEVSGKDDSYSSYASSSDGEFSSFSSCSKRYNRSRGNSPVTSPQMSRRSDGNNNSRNASPRVSPLSSPNPSPKFPKKNNKRQDHSPARNGHKLSPLVKSKSPSSSPDPQRKENGSSPPRHSPWMLRKMQLNGGLGGHELLQAGNKKLDIVRQPKGPDGSNGFSNHPLKKYILVHAF